jgi:hypothetical protein
MARKFWWLSRPDLLTDTEWTEFIALAERLGPNAFQALARGVEDAIIRRDVKAMFGQEEAQDFPNLEDGTAWLAILQALRTEVNDATAE